MPGPLAGIRIIEFSGVGPAPFACMMLADHGAEVIRICRPGSLGSDRSKEDAQKNVLLRSRATIELNLKSKEGLSVIRDLLTSADGLIEGYRPGVMERVGLGPVEVASINSALVYGRMTGWGQSGPYAHLAGHDINYIALAGALHAFGKAEEKPIPPINLVGDFGGGGMLLAFGMVSALYHARMTGQGQVIDAAMVDGAALLMSMIWGLRAQGRWRDERGVNLLDGGAHFYNTYKTLDGKYIAIGAIEKDFYTALRKKLRIDLDPEFDAPMDRFRWEGLSAKLASIFEARTQADWCALFEAEDVCFAPVLSMAEAPQHPHNQDRGVFIEVDGVVQPSPAPHFSRTPARAPEMYDGGTQTRQILGALGYDSMRIEQLMSSGHVL